MQHSDWTLEANVAEYLDVLSDFWPRMMTPTHRKAKSGALVNAWLRPARPHPFKSVMDALEELHSSWDSRNYPKPKHLEKRLKERLGLVGAGAQEEMWKRRIAQLATAGRTFTAKRGEKEIRFKIDEEGIQEYLPTDEGRIARGVYHPYSSMDPAHRYQVVHLALLQGGELREEELRLMTHQEFLESEGLDPKMTFDERLDQLAGKAKHSMDMNKELAREPGQEG